ncbi:MAG: type VI secretion system contractile sheath domain-containing protein [Burkholderiales bacterium]
MNFEFELTHPSRRMAVRPRAESPMRILVMGDFSGRANRGIENHADLGERTPLSVDADDFERVMSRLSPRLHLAPGAAGGPAVDVELDQLDHLHPDGLYRRLPVFQALREMRRRLQNPETFSEAAAELRSELHRPGESKPEPPPGAEPDEPDADTLARLLGAQSATALGGAAKPAQQSPIDALIRNIVAPHIRPEPAPFQDQYVSSIDAAVSAEMRRILHHPDFQALEAAWRGVHGLVSRLELGETLKLHVLDVSKAELLEDIRGQRGDIESMGLYRLLVEQGWRATGGEPWSTIVGLYEFGTEGGDIALLACLGSIAALAGGPFLASAKTALAGFHSAASMPDPRDWKPAEDSEFEGWRALRESALASWLGLASPRMLLRLPYGKATDCVEGFEFEELAAAREHERYLWGNGALACAQLLARAFLTSGWEMAPGDELDVDGLPAHTYLEDGEKHLQPCAESIISDRAGQALLERGLIPLLSYKNRNAVRVMRLQSIADPAQPLSGPWADR